MKKIIVIVGPTCSGKSKFAIELAKKIDGEIINADCFQVYKQLNIGTNKTSKEEMGNIKHHLIDFLNIDEQWDISRFKKSAEKIIDNSKKPIIIVGGSNLYIHCLINNYDLSNNQRSNSYSKFSIEELQELLSKKDIDLCKKIGPNKKRLERALEIIDENNSLSKCNKLKYKSFIIFINYDRNELYEKINRNVDSMIANGWLDEIKKIVNKYDKNCNALKAIGYKAIIENDLTIDEELINRIKKETRNYAKRQITWCRNKFKIILNKSNNQLQENDIKLIKRFINEKN